MQIKSDRKAAVCQNCGLEYPLEMLKQKLHSGNVPDPGDVAPRDVKPAPPTPKSTVAQPSLEEEPIFDAVCETIGSKTSASSTLSRNTVLNVWRQYLPQVMPQYSLGMRINGALKGCYLAPDIPADCAQRASRYLTKGKVAPQDILGHYSFKPQGGLAGIVVAQDCMFLPVGKLGMEYIQIVYAELSRAEVKKDASHKIRTEMKLLTYTNELTLYYKNGNVKTYTTNAQYNAGVIAQALNELIR